MIDVKCPHCMRSYELAYDPKTVIGQPVRCKACGVQFVVNRDVSLPTAAPGWEPMSNGTKLPPTGGKENESMITVKCPQCKRSYPLNYDPKAVIGRGVKCRACGAQFVVGAGPSAHSAGPAGLPGWGSMPKEKKILLIGISAGLLLVAGIVVAIVLGLRTTSSGGRQYHGSDNRVRQTRAVRARTLPPGAESGGEDAVRIAKIIDDFDKAISVKQENTSMKTDAQAEAEAKRIFDSAAAKFENDVNSLGEISLTSKICNVGNDNIGPYVSINVPSELDGFPEFRCQVHISCLEKQLLDINKGDRVIIKGRGFCLKGIQLFRAPNSFEILSSKRFGEGSLLDKRPWQVYSLILTGATVEIGSNKWRCW